MKTYREKKRDLYIRFIEMIKDIHGANLGLENFEVRTIPFRITSRILRDKFGMHILNVIMVIVVLRKSTRNHRGP